MRNPVWWASVEAISTLSSAVSPTISGKARAAA